MIGDDRAALLLGLGALTGVLLAAAGVVQQDDAAGSLPEGAVARVGGDLILKVDYERILEAMASDRRHMDEAARQRVLDRLIDEALLVQRGQELGLAEREPRVRTLLSASVLDLLVAQAEAADTEPDEAQLRAFYEDHRDYFRRPARAHVRRITFSERASGGAPKAMARASAAAARLREGEPFEVVSSSGDAQPIPLPDSLLPVGKLGDYLGPTLAQAATALRQGELSAPLRGVGGVHLLKIIEVEPGDLRPFSEVVEEVRAERRRRIGEAGVAAFLKARRGSVPIVVDAERL